jgi:multimeric flavodoxin WrbA
MKLLGIVGSMRKEGSTAKLVAAVMEAARELGRLLVEAARKV